MRQSILCAAAFICLTNAALAAVPCPRVTCEHNADVTDLSRFRQFARWKHKTGNDLAIAVWQYLCDRQTGLYHMNEVIDGPDPSKEYATVRDPLKLLNVYNVGYCGIFGPALDGIFQGIGFEQGRSFGIPKWAHSTTEVWYDNAWHYFDLDLRGALLRADGVVASLAEARTHRELWTAPLRRIEPFFPKDTDKGRVFDIYRASDIDYYYRQFQSGHTMDFVLRQGESLTRWWRPQGGRWHHIDTYHQTPWLKSLIAQDPPGYKSNHADFSVWTQGNGLWQYEPNLQAPSTDFEDGMYAVENLRSGAEGATFVADGVGRAVVEVFTPWIIVPQVGVMDDPEDDGGASVMTLEAAVPLTLELSLDGGRTWTEISKVPPGVARLDVTRQVKGTYGYLARLAGEGRAGQTALRSLRIETWVQVAPISLPRLMAGQNRCRYEAGDRYGKQTVPAFVLPNVADPEHLRKFVQEMPSRYDPSQLTSRIQGDVVLKLTSAPGTKIDWFTAGAAFTTHQGTHASRTANRIAYAVGQPQEFQEIYRSEVPEWVNHWRYQWDQDVCLPEPAETVYVRYTGAPAVNVLRATLHQIAPRPPQQAVQITHGYLIGGRPMEKTVDLTGPSDYTVIVDGEPENVFLRMTVPSQ